MYQFQYQPQQGTGPRIPASQGASAGYMQAQDQMTIMQKQMEEEKKRADRGMYFDIANTIFKGIGSIGGLFG